jgi:hypothetical protein
MRTSTHKVHDAVAHYTYQNANSRRLHHYIIIPQIAKCTILHIPTTRTRKQEFVIRGIPTNTNTDDIKDWIEEKAFSLFEIQQFYSTKPSIADIKSGIFPHNKRLTPVFRVSLQNTTTTFTYKNLAHIDNAIIHSWGITARQKFTHYKNLKNYAFQSTLKTQIISRSLFTPLHTQQDTLPKHS